MVGEVNAWDNGMNGRMVMIDWIDQLIDKLTSIFVGCRVRLP